jgi:hypothetical protein
LATSIDVGDSVRHPSARRSRLPATGIPVCAILVAVAGTAASKAIWIEPPWALKPGEFGLRKSVAMGMCVPSDYGRL